MQSEKIKFVFFGSSEFSRYVLEALEEKGYTPVLNITSAREPLPIEKLKEINADVFIVASFGKILPEEVIYMPKAKTLNVHPSLLPKLRGAAPLQYTILTGEEAGVTIMRMNEKMDEGPIVAQEKVGITDMPRYREFEARMGRRGGELLAEILPGWVEGKIPETEQDSSKASYTKKIQKSDADITNDSPEVALRKIRAYEVWPRARKGDLIITEAHVENGELVLDRVLPPGKKEMSYADYLHGQRGKQ